MIGWLLLTNLALIVIYMTVWFMVARKRQRFDTVDSAWGGGFVVMAWSVALQAPAWRSFVLALLVTIWAARLTFFLVRRNARKPEDRRYVEMAKKWRGNVWLRAYLSVFLAQGLFIWIISLPLVMAAGDLLPGPLQWLTLAGVVVWLAGFIFESVADRQLATFLADKANKGKNMDRGLWRYSRHPNYFGELVQWWAIGLFALQAGWGWVGLLGPLVLSWTLIFVSGIPPIENKRRNDANYQAYKRRTSPLIPLPPRQK